MRVALVGDGCSPARPVECCAAALKRADQDVAVYTGHVGGVGALRDDEMVSFMGQLARELDEAWAAYRPDVVHAHGWDYGIAAQLAARHHGLPTVQSFRPKPVRKSDRVMADERQRSKLETLLVKNASWLAPRCSEDSFALLRLGADRSRMSVLSRGVDVDMFATDCAAANHDLRLIVVVGRNPITDGFDTAIRALRYVPTARLLLVCDGDMDTLRQLARSCGIADRVRFSATVPYAELPALLSTADVVACPPAGRPSETVVLEAMAAGVPVVASAVGELLELVVHDVTGLLVKPGDPADLAGALRKLLADEFRSHGMGLAGRDRAASRYRWDRIATESLAIYRKLHARNCGPVTGAKTAARG